MNRHQLLLTASVAASTFLGIALGANHSPAEAQGGVEQWRPTAEAACATFGCDPNYILNVMSCESGGNPWAVGPNGELGLMQIQPAIWGTFSPEGSIWFAAEHLTAGDIYWACA
jgi:soluble lytic murein transglycosylase-like protein